ncbi:MAG: shikimate dehydrogenase [Synergistaceae bacterium]|jgi:shikimate dehydrogenase|nr:shikimate dehydrogenase [Synergistaceae bacterium]
MRHALLIGLSGSGKSTLGRLAACEFGLPFVDLDDSVEARTGMKIREIFALHGEARFRDEESLALDEALKNPVPSIIATGGGVVLRPENARAMRESGFVVFLDRPLENILRDVRCDGERPLLTDAGKLYEMERDRRALYLEASDSVQSGGAVVGESLGELVKLLSALWAGPPIPLPEYCVIGDPIAHTLSPAIHGAIFGALGSKVSYGALRVPRGELGAFVERVRNSNMRGFNVTIPHKIDIIPLLDDVVEEARLCGAVNTVAIREGRFYGYNTDMGGLLASLIDAGSGYAGRNILILGAGGASRGVALKAAREEAAGITILARRAEVAAEIASSVRPHASCRVRAGEMSGEAMTREARAADVLINTTPLGMSGLADDFVSLDFLSGMPSDALVCDLVYNPPVTSLLRAAGERGLAARNGLGMLIYQAILADEIFLGISGRELDVPTLYKTAKERLER